MNYSNRKQAFVKSGLVLGLILPGGVKIIKYNIAD